jgi:hypothetical protein
MKVITELRKRLNVVTIRYFYPILAITIMVEIKDKNVLKQP